MKINPAAYNIGKTGSLRPAEADANPKVQAEAAVKAESSKTDQIQISSQGALKAEIDHLTRSIVGEMEKPAPPERLAAISLAVKSGNYHIPTADLVNSIMQRWMGF